MTGFSVDIGALQSAASQIAGIADELASMSRGPESAAASVVSAFPDSPANGVLLALGQQLGSAVDALVRGHNEDVGTLVQNVTNYLAADGSLRG